MTKMGGFYFSKMRRPQTIGVVPQCGRCQTPGKKESPRKLFEGRSKNTVLNFFDFSKHDYNSAENTEFWARSNFNSFANLGLLMANDGALEP